MTDDITLRSPAADELQAFFGPLLAAFSEDWSAGEFEAERPLMELDRLVNAFDGERRIGSAGAFSMQLTVPGGIQVPVSGVTAVGVQPDYRRRGVLRRMMTWLIDDATRRGEPMAVLWASEGAIYQRFGFGLSTLGSGFEVDRARVVFRDPLPPQDDVQVRLVEPDEGARLCRAIYETVRQTLPGALDRPELKWQTMLMPDAEWMRQGSGRKHRAVLEVGGEPRAYAVYRMNNEWSPRGPAGTLLVIEAYAVDAESEQRLWQWLASMDLVATLSVRRGPVPHPLHLWVQEPRRLAVTTYDGLWLRFIDVAAALEARRYSGEGRLVLEIADGMIESNAGRWQIHARADGTATVTHAAAEAESDLALDVSALACAYLGAFRFGDLARAGSSIRFGTMRCHSRARRRRLVPPTGRTPPGRICPPE